MLLISHDRELLSAACDAIVTLEGDGCWVHGGSYATYPEAREHRQALMGDRLQRWKEEEQRLRELVRIFKERARYSPDLGQEGERDRDPLAALRSTTARRPRRSSTTRSSVRLRGGDSARRVLDLRTTSASTGSSSRSSDEIHFGERVGLIGPNGTGKTHLMRLLAGEDIPHDGRARPGPARLPRPVHAAQRARGLRRRAAARRRDRAR